MRLPTPPPLLSSLTLALVIPAGAFSESAFFELLPQGYLYSAAAYGNGVYAVVGEQGSIRVSRDTFHWRDKSVETEDLVAVAFGGGRFIALGSEGQILASATGDDWQPEGVIALPVDAYITGLAYGSLGQGTFAAVDTAGRVLSSSDGLSWVPVYATATEETFTGITYGSGKFAVVGTDYDDNGDTRGIVRVSSTGTTWTRERYQIDEELYGVTWARDKFIAVGVRYNNDFDAFSRLLTSATGANWSSRSVSGDSILYTAGFGNGYYWAAGEAGAILRSFDGVSGWTAAPYLEDDASEIRASASGPSGELILVGERLLTSPKSGGRWIDLMEIDSLDLGEVAHGGGSYVALGADGVGWISRDSTNWIPARITPPTLDSVKWTGLTFGGNTFVAVGSGWDLDLNDIGAVAVSSDGLQWSIVRSQLLESPSDVTYANNQFVAVGAYELAGNHRTLILTSVNGITWTRRDVANPPGSNEGPSLLGITHGSPVGFVAVGHAGAVRTSANGVDWSLRVVDTAADLRAVGFQGGTFLSVGSQGAAWSSIDGVSWVRSSAPSEVDWSGVLDFPNGQLVLGQNGSVLLKGAGGTLDAVPTVTSSTLAGGVYAEGGLLITGLDGAVAVSQDGRAWTLLHGPGAAVPIHMSITESGVLLTVTVTGPEGRRVRLEHAGSLRPGASWELLSEVTILNGKASATDHLNAQGHRFYRGWSP